MEIVIGQGGAVEIVTAFKEDKEVSKGQELYDYLKEKELFSFIRYVLNNSCIRNYIEARSKLIHKLK